MSNIDWYKANLAAKRAEMRLNARSESKNDNIDDMRRKYRAITAKKAQITVKTDKNDEYKATDAQFREKCLSEWKAKRADSTPNPNAAFRHKKDKKMSIMERIEASAKVARSIKRKAIDR